MIMLKNLAPQHIHQISCKKSYVNIEVKKNRYQTIKQKEQSKLKIQKTRQSHEIRRHK